MSKEPKATPRKITDYQPDPANPNAHSERGVGVLSDSIASVGLGRSIVVDRNGIVLAGNSTQERAVDQGFEDAIEVESDGTKLIVVKRTDLDLSDDKDNRARKLSYYDNRAAELGIQWDAEQLLADINAGVDLSHLFTAGELDELLADLQTDTPADDPGAQIDRAEELQAKWNVERGQLWVIGDHRLLCGDSTNAGDVARVMGGEKAGMVFTDPPYNLAGNYDVHAKDIRQSYRDLKDAEWDQSFDIKPFLNVLLDYICKDVSVYICSAQPIIPTIWAWMNEWSDHSSYVVWCKENPMPSLAKRHWTFGTELVSYATRGKHIFNFPSDGHALNWWDINTQQANREHPTQKPVEVPTHAIKHSSHAGAIVFDGFLGSGTTLVACEQTGRKGRGIEIEPKYCAVILERMSGMGITPRLSE